MSKSNNYQGMALVLVMALLMAVTVMGVAFVRITMMENKTTSYWRDQTQANLAGAAGLDYAVARLYECFRKDEWYVTGNSECYSPVWYYGGEDIDGDHILDFGEDVNGNGRLEIMDCPLPLAQVPSFMGGEYQGLPYSGNLCVRNYEGVTTQNRQALYTLKVEDLSGRIYLPQNVDLNLPTGTARMLSTLASLVTNSSAPDMREIGGALLLYGLNPTQMGLNSAFEGLEGQVSKISGYVTAYGWLDQSTIKPPAWSDVTPEVREAVVAANPGFGESQWLNPTGNTLPKPIRYCGIALEPRAPININSAPFEVLVAAVNGLKARVVRPGFVSSDEDTSKLELLALDQGYLDAAYPVGERNYVSYVTGRTEPVASLKNQGDRLEYVEIDLETAKSVAEAIMAHRVGNPFTSWPDLAGFLAQLIVAGTLDPQQASLIWANANPNTDLNKNHPDFPDSFLYSLWTAPDRERSKSLFYRVDKSDLIVYTSEFCFIPPAILLSTVMPVYSSKTT